MKNRYISLLIIFFLLVLCLVNNANGAESSNNNNRDGESNENFESDNSQGDDSELSISPDERSFICELLIQALLNYHQFLLKFCIIFTSDIGERYLTHYKYFVRLFSTQTNNNNRSKMVDINRSSEIYYYTLQFQNMELLKQLEEGFKRTSFSMFEVFRTNVEALLNTLSMLISSLMEIQEEGLGRSLDIFVSQVVSFSISLIDDFCEIMERNEGIKPSKFKRLLEGKDRYFKHISFKSSLDLQSIKIRLNSRRNSEIMNEYNSYEKTGLWESQKFSLDDAVSTRNTYYLNLDYSEEQVFRAECLVSFSLDVLCVIMYNVLIFYFESNKEIADNLNKIKGEIMEFIASRGTEANISSESSLKIKDEVKKLVKYDETQDMNVLSEVLLRSLSKEELLSSFKSQYKTLLCILVLLKGEVKSEEEPNYVGVLLSKVTSVFESNLKLIAKIIKDCEQERSLFIDKLDDMLLRTKEKRAKARKYILDLTKKKEQVTEKETDVEDGDDKSESVEKRKRTRSKYESKMKNIKFFTELFGSYETAPKVVKEGESTSSSIATVVKREPTSDLSRKEKRLMRIEEDEAKSQKIEEIRRKTALVKKEYSKSDKKSKTKEGKSHGKEHRRRRKGKDSEDKTEEKKEEEQERDGLKIIDIIVNSLGGLQSSKGETGEKLISLSNEVFSMAKESFEADDDLNDYLLCLAAGESEEDLEQDKICEASGFSSSASLHAQAFSIEGTEAQGHTPSRPRSRSRHRSHSRRRSHSRHRSHHRSRSSSSSRSRSRSRSFVSKTKRKADDLPKESRTPTVELFGEKPVFSSKDKDSRKGEKATTSKSRHKSHSESKKQLSSEKILSGESRGDSTSKSKSSHKSERADSGRIEDQDAKKSRERGQIKRRSKSRERRKSKERSKSRERGKGKVKGIHESGESSTQDQQPEFNVFSKKINDIVSQSSGDHLPSESLGKSRFMKIFESGKSGTVSSSGKECEALLDLSSMFGLDKLDFSNINERSTSDELFAAIELCGDTITKIHLEFVPLLSGKNLFYANLLKNELIKLFIKLLILSYSRKSK
ncbi:hypothetical protein OJ252_1050 [Cryptosporidium canis]|uniref:Signal peptide-containing protein n=1 Tax=Cryptosporidium canis TaxID=195482 RepID=A0ABQ8PC30_9CRYT|nr:hypothetical protein OJ252_1050 [Cryptosporidium canis]